MYAGVGFFLVLAAAVLLSGQPGVTVLALPGLAAYLAVGVGIVLALQGLVLNAVRLFGPVPFAALMVALGLVMLLVLFGTVPAATSASIFVGVGDLNLSAGLVPTVVVVTAVFFFVLRRKLAEIFD